MSPCVQWSAALGFHTNDVESENNRIKHWARARYSTLKLEESDMYEYVFYTNVGKSMTDVMHGLAVANGERYRRVIL